MSVTLNIKKSWLEIIFKKIKNVHKFDIFYKKSAFPTFSPNWTAWKLKLFNKFRFFLITKHIKNLKLEKNMFYTGGIKTWNFPQVFSLLSPFLIHVSIYFHLVSIRAFKGSSNLLRITIWFCQKLFGNF